MVAAARRAGTRRTLSQLARHLVEVHRCERCESGVPRAKVTTTIEPNPGASPSLSRPRTNASARNTTPLVSEADHPELPGVLMAVRSPAPGRVPPRAEARQTRGPVPCPCIRGPCRGRGRRPKQPSFDSAPWTSAWLRAQARVVLRVHLVDRGTRARRRRRGKAPATPASAWPMGVSGAPHPTTITRGPAR